MFVLESYAVAVVFCVITMLCWGSWANTQKKAGETWPFELFYWDYVIGVLVMAVIFAFTFGSLGSAGRSFLADLSQANWTSIGLALTGGAIFNAANILLVAAIAVSGMAVAFPVGIGLALVIGVVVNYIAQPAGDATLLFLGVGLITVAIILAAISYSRLPGQGKTGVTRGLVLAVACGVLMGYFYRFVAASMSADFVMMEAGKLSPYTAMVLFAVGMAASQLVFNFSRFIGWATDAEATRPAYFSGSRRDHTWGVAGGMIWAIGMTFSIIAFGVAGPAISYGLGQGATLVAALWGVFIWKEFKDAPSGTNTLITLMFAGYLIGLGMIIWSGI